MTVFRWIIFMLLTILAILPVTRLKIFDISKKYHHFKYLSIFLFIWTLSTWLLYVSNQPTLQYYLTLAVYPIIFILTTLLLVSIMFYLDKKIPKIFKYVFILAAILEFILAFTNPLHHWFIKHNPSDFLNYQSMALIERGPLFYIHTFICYIILVVTIVLILQKLIKDLRRDQDIMPFLIMSLGIFFGISANITHIFIKQFVIDPTFIAFVVLISLLYAVFYMRDIRLIIEFNRNQFILDNFREMYIMCNHRNIVVDASDEFLERFNIDIDKKHTIVELLESISDKCVIYEDPTNISKNFNSNKTYLHLKRKTIDFPLFKHQGNFYLLYDETNTQKYIHEVNYAKSHDLMTNLYNRNHYEEIKQTIDETYQNYLIYLFDLDGLKLYNDSLGHATGDYILKSLAAVLSRLAIEYNLVAIRMGGDEFILIQPDKDLVDTKRIIDEVINQDIDLKYINKITFSYGFAEKKSSNEDIEEVLKKADQEMYKMKLVHESDKSNLKELISKEAEYRKQKG